MRRSTTPTTCVRRCAPPRLTTPAARICAPASTSSNRGRCPPPLSTRGWGGCFTSPSRRTRSPCRFAGRPVPAPASGPRPGQRYKRIYGLQRGKEMRLKAIDFESRQREQEAAELTAELASSAGAGIYQVAVNLTLISPPDPKIPLRTEEDRHAHREQRAKALQRWTRALEEEVLTRTDARLHLPWFAQLDAWRSTWPLGDRRARTQAPVRHAEPRRHDPAGQRALRLAERDSARLGAPGPHARQARPLRPVARQPHHDRVRTLGVREDDGHQPVAGADHADGRDRRRHRPRRPL